MANGWNGVLEERRNLLSIASRTPIAPGCPASVTLPDGTTVAQPAGTIAAQGKRWTLNRIPLSVATAGDNSLISTLIGAKNIYEIFLWNVGAQTLSLYQGPSASGILLLKLTDFPALTGFVLGFNGSFEMPHFSIDAGQPFVLNLSAGTEVDGFVIYAVPEAS